MMTAERPSDDAAVASPAESAALGEWFADGAAPEEVQALRAWVAGLSHELAEARRARDEAQQALLAAMADIAALRGRLAELDSAPPPLSAAATHSGEGADVSPYGELTAPVDAPHADSRAAAPCAAAPVNGTASALADLGPSQPGGPAPAATQDCAPEAGGQEALAPPPHAEAGDRRVRLLATVVLLLLVAAAVAISAGPRLMP